MESYAFIHTCTEVQENHKRKEVPRSIRLSSQNLKMKTERWAWLERTFS